MNNLHVQNDIVQDVTHDGIVVINPSGGSAVTSGALIAHNLVHDFQAYGIALDYNAYGDITNNTVAAPDNAFAGIFVYDFTASGATAATMTVNVSSNTVTVGPNAFGGIWANLFHPSTTASLNISGNTINGSADVVAGDPVFGIYLTSLNSNGVTVAMNDNTIGSSGGALWGGISVWNAPGANISIAGGSIANATYGINLDNHDLNFGNATGTMTLNVGNVALSNDYIGIWAGATSGVTGGAKP